MSPNRRGIPLFFIPVMLLSGTGMGMALYVWFRMYTNLFGIHRFAVSSVLVVMVLCLGYGGRIGGRLADKTRDSLVIFTVMQALAGLYSLFNPLIFSRLTALLSMIIRDMHPSAFGMGMIRILLCFLFLLIPLFSFGGLLPALGRRFASQPGWAGSRLSIILSTVFTGLFTGLALAGFLLVPGNGMNQTMLISSLVSLFAFVLSLAYIIGIKSIKTGWEPAVMVKRSGRSPMLFRKRKIVLEAIGKLTRAMLRTNVLHSFTVVSLLIITVRLMTAYSTIAFAYLHILVLLVFFAGVALGNLFFRTINTRTVNGYLVLASLEILTGFAILFGYVLFTVVAPPLQLLSLDAQSWSTRIGYHLILISSLVFVPAFSTGTILPLAGQMYTRLARKTGRNLGKLNMQYYTGALVGILVTHHVLLPIAGSVWSFFLILVFMIFSGI